VIAAVNRVLHENVRKRMGRDDYLTLMAARHTGDGRFVAAGAHQPVFLGRAGGTVDVIEPVGPWCGLTDDLDGRVHEFEFRVAHGETVCLITDGIVEAQDEAEQLFGEERLSEVVAETAGLPATQALSTLFSRVEAFAKTQSDDMTAVVLRRIA
jgi:sigma-B regulation protein RsbU (phosphoserine phosphatase)